MSSLQYITPILHISGAVDIGNVPPTRVYINYKHHVVAQLRKKLVFQSNYSEKSFYFFMYTILQNRLQNPEFVKQVFAENKRKEILLMRLAEVKKLGNEYIEVNLLYKLSTFK